MLYTFFCIYLYFLIYFIVFDNKTYIFVFANWAYFLFALIQYPPLHRIVLLI